MLDRLPNRLRDALDELRYAMRGLRRDPAFTVTAILILALGCGAYTAMLIAVRGLLLDPLPFPQPERLMSIYELRSQQGDAEASRLGVALDTLPDWRDVDGIDSLAGYRLRSFGLQTAEPMADGESTAGPHSSLSEIEVVQVGMSTAGLFRTLGIEPRLGRGFSAEEERSDRLVMTITHGLWQRAFAADPDILGQQLWLNGEAYTIVGVLPADFRMVIRGRVPDTYIPISHGDYGGSRGKRALEVIARLGQDADPTAVRGELTALGGRLATAHPKTHHGVGIGAESLDTAWRGANRRPLTWLLAGAGLLLLAVCANVAGLMLARSLRRRRRQAIRAALGAGALRLALPTLLEGALLGLGGGVAGLWIATLALRALPLALPVLGGAELVADFQLASLDLDLGSAASACTLAVACGLLVSWWPIQRLRRCPPAHDLGTTRSPSFESIRAGSMVVVAQVALGTILLLAAGLLGRSFMALLNSNPGFETTRVTSFGLGLPEARYDTEPKIIDFHRDLHRELADLPGVVEVGAAARRPLVRGFSTSFEREDAPSPDSQRLGSAINVVSPGYFKALRIPLVAGRLPNWNDNPGDPRVLVINEAFRRAYFPSELSSHEVLSRRLRLSWWSALTAKGTPWQIVGVVGDVRQQRLDAAASPEIYLPLSQFPAEGATYLLRSHSGEPVPVQQIATAVEQLDPDLQKISAGPARQWAADSLADRRLALVVIAILGLAALLTTAIGVYALVATDVAGRRDEMTIRRALGARPDQISSLVIGRGLKWVGLGFAVGAGLFMVLSFGLRHLLYGVGPADPLTFIGIWGLLSAVAAIAGLGPALQAAEADTPDR